MVRPVAARPGRRAAFPFGIGHFVLADGEGMRDRHLVSGLLIPVLVRAHGKLTFRHHHQRWTEVAIPECEPRLRRGTLWRHRHRSRLSHGKVIAPAYALGLRINASAGRFPLDWFLSPRLHRLRVTKKAFSKSPSESLISGPHHRPDLDVLRLGLGNCQRSRQEKQIEAT